MSVAHWEHFHHEADVGVCGVGATRAEAFEQVAMAMTAVMTDLELVGAKREIELDCEAPDDELLLVDWLNALVYEMAVQKMLFSHFEVHLNNNHLHAKVQGEALNIEKHCPAVEIKGATYTALRVFQDEDGNWHACCVIDV